MRAVPLLRAPLRLAWVHDSGLSVPVVSKSVTYLRVDHGCVARDSDTGEELWKFRPHGVVSGAAFARGDEVFLYTDREFEDTRPGNRVSLTLADERTGQVKGSAPLRGQQIVGDSVVLNTYSEILVWSWSRARMIWKKDFGEDSGNDAMRVGCTGDRLIRGQRNGAVVCVALETGEKIWEISVADLYKDKVARDPGCVMTDFFFFGDLVVFSTMGHSLGISLETGRTVWRTRKHITLRGYLGDRIHGTQAGTLDPYTGDYDLGPGLENPPGPSKRLLGFLDSLQTSTHVFESASNGSVHAWDRMTGKHVWGMKLKGAKGGYGLKIAYGRLYYVSATQQTYCLEEVNPSEVASPGTAEKESEVRKEA